MCKRKRRHPRSRRQIRNQTGSGVFKTIKSKLKVAKREPRSNKKKKEQMKTKVDVHGMATPIIKALFGKRGMVPPGYRYLGPGNQLDKQLVINTQKGTIKKYLKHPTNKLDKIASKHD